MVIDILDIEIRYIRTNTRKLFPFSYWNQSVWNLMDFRSLMEGGILYPLYWALQMNNKTHITTPYEMRTFKNRFILMPAF